MIKHLKPAIILFVLLSVLTGVIYPAVVTGLAQLLFPYQANGSLITGKNGKLIDSRLIGQPFRSPGYFWGRPSATGPFPYNAGASSGSNLGPTNPALVDAVKARIEALKAADPDNKAPVPVDLITASGSGLDPHISPAAADYQIKRVAKVRKVNPGKLQELVNAHTEARQWGFLGEPRVSVLTLNLALDAVQVTTEDASYTDYTLPPSKVYIKLCQKEALLLHPGVIEKERMLHINRDFLVEYEIQAHGANGEEWLVLCALSTGKIVREQKLIGNAS
ncbi:MAG: potassium-transporting ATPase subunit KdpC [Methylococcales bacterium]|nr:potassium-transporting ATPase subunit KdpC [Methylococcales bacterium]